MKPLNLRLKSLASIGAVLMMGAITSSCSQDDMEPTPPFGADQPILIGADIAKELSSRSSYLDQGDITTGIYYLMYTSKSTSKYVLANVNFDLRDDKYGIGGGPEGDLAWAIIGKTTFFMDNVPASLNKSTAVDKVTFVTNNPYVAGPVLPDTENEGSFIADNDLLWGTTTTTANASTINFEMHHVMSKVKIQITVDRTNAIGDEYDFDDAKVSITSLIHKPESYDRVTGEVANAANPAYEDLVFVDRIEGHDGIGWASIDVDPDDPNIVTYTTYDFILPPQALKVDDSRPKLVINIKTPDYPDGKTFSGYLPHAMEVEYPGIDDPYPANLAFLREHYLTIRTKLSKEPPELIFMPVWVYKWVDKLEHTVDGYQAGIYDEEEFLRLANYYEADYSIMFRRFGKQMADGSWRFNLFGNMEFDIDEIWGTMKKTSNQPDYSFYLDNFFTITILDDGAVKYKLSGQQGADIFYQIVSGNTDYMP